MNGEIRRHSARAHETEKSLNQHTKEVKGCEVEPPDETDQDIESLDIHSELDEEEELEDVRHFRNIC